MSSRVLQINVKPKTPGEPGLPKRPVPEARILPGGLDGDFNDWRSANLPGDQKQAVLIITAELLGQLNAEGWPVKPGDMGENLTLDGIPESALRPGVRLEAGDVVLEITEPCDPCTRLYTLPYIGAERGPAFLRATAGRRGWYARVVQPGSIRRGSPISLVTAAVTRTPG